MTAAIFIPFGGSSGSAQDYYGPTYIVGNSLEGDTLDNVQYLDDGTGDELRVALAAAALTGGQVHVRRGTYALRHAGGETVVPSNAVLQGEGDGTILALPNEGQIYSLLVQGLVRDCAIAMVGQPTAALLSATNRFVEMQSGGRIESCLLQINANVNSVGFYPGFYSLVRMSQPTCQMNECRLRGYSSVALGAGSECLGVQAIGGLCSVNDCVFGDTGSDLFDVAVEVGEANYNSVRDCTISRTRIHGVRVVAVFDMEGTRVQGCTIDARSGRGIGLDWFGNGTVRGTVVQGNIIDCAAGITAGIDFVSPDAAQLVDFIAVQGNTLIGAAGGIGIRIQETGTGNATNVSDSLNSVYNFATAKDVVAGASQVGNVP